MPKLIQLSAFFRNDKPDGVGVTLTEEFGDLDDVLSTIKTNWDAMWRLAVQESNTRELIDDLFRQLDVITKFKEDGLGPTEITILIGNLYLLERIGELTGDEFNGLLLVYQK